MKDVCPYCQAEREVAWIETTKEMTHKGQSFVIPDKYFKCLTCQKDYERLDGYDSLKVLYKEYDERMKEKGR